jgi:hypothetical protein
MQDERINMLMTQYLLIFHAVIKKKERRQLQQFFCFLQAIIMNTSHDKRKPVMYFSKKSYGLCNLLRRYKNPLIEKIQLIKFTKN